MIVQEQQERDQRYTNRLEEVDRHAQALRENDFQELRIEENENTKDVTGSRSATSVSVLEEPEPVLNNNKESQVAEEKDTSDKVEKESTKADLVDVDENVDKFGEDDDDDAGEKEKEELDDVEAEDDAKPDTDGEAKPLTKSQKKRQKKKGKK